jgi:molybdopterin converting factor small subunit
MGVIRVTVRGHVAKYFPQEQDSFDFPTDRALTALELLRALNVDPLLIMGVSVNGAKQPKDALINLGDEVLFFSPPAGGS